MTFFASRLWVLAHRTPDALLYNGRSTLAYQDHPHLQSILGSSSYDLQLPSLDAYLLPSLDPGPLA